MGFPEEHDSAVKDMNLTAAQCTEIQHATQTTVQRLVEGLIAAGKYDWQVRAGQGAQRSVGVM